MSLVLSIPAQSNERYRKSGLALERRVGKALEDSGFQVDYQVPVGDGIADFIIRHPRYRVPTVVEVKRTLRHSGFLQAWRYASRLGAPRVLLVASRLAVPVDCLGEHRMFISVEEIYREVDRNGWKGIPATSLVLWWGI